MKGFIMIPLVLLLNLNGFSQLATKTSLYGTSVQLKGGKLIITNTGVFKQEFPVTATGSFNADLQIAPGFYVTNTGVQLYLEPGMKLKMFQTDGATTFTGEGSDENNLLSQLQLLEPKYLPVKAKRITEAGYMMPAMEFLDHLASYRAEADKLITAARITPETARLNKQMVESTGKYLTYMYMIQYGTDAVKKDAAMKTMLAIPRGADGKPDMEAVVKLSQLVLESHTKHHTLEERKSLEVLEGLDLNNGELYFASGDYRKLIDLRLDRLLSAERIITPSIAARGLYEGKISVAAKYITNPAISEHLFYSNTALLMMRSKDREATFSEYLKLAKNQEYIADLEKAVLTTRKMATGSLSPAFAFTDVGGNTVTLASFKGNYVYIDLWATWCEPCIAEIPALKKLEKDYEGKKISFVSISTDQPKDTGKWKKFVAGNALTGTQLIAPRESEFIKFYNVITIPRFVLLDPEGKIVSADANRPSNPVLRNELNELLK